MMNHGKLAQKADTVNSLIYVLEGLIEEAELRDAGEKQKRIADMYTTLLEHIHELTALAFKVDADINVCNAIYASNYVKKLQIENEKLRKKIEAYYLQ